MQFTKAQENCRKVTLFFSNLDFLVVHKITQTLVVADIKCALFCIKYPTCEATVEFMIPVFSCSLTKRIGDEDYFK